MNQIYRCVNGHTFDRPLTRNNLCMVHFCPICNTADIENIQTLLCNESSLQSPVKSSCIMADKNICSSYETWAKKEQPVVLGRTVTLGEAITAIKNYVPVYSDTMIIGMKTLVENIFGITGGEVNRLIDGVEYWMC